MGLCCRDFRAQRRAREQSQVGSESSTTDVAERAAFVSAIKALQADEHPAEKLFQGASYCAMEFTGDLDKID